MKIWPWSEFKKLNDWIEYERRAVDRVSLRERFYKSEYLKFKESLRGAHTGIRRLIERQKRLKAENARLKAGLHKAGYHRRVHANERAVSVAVYRWPYNPGELTYFTHESEAMALALAIQAMEESNNG